MNLPTFNGLFGFGLAFLDFVSDLGNIMDSFVLELSVRAGMNEFFAFDTSTVGVLIGSSSSAMQSVSSSAVSISLSNEIWSS